MSSSMPSPMPSSVPPNLPSPRNSLENPGAGAGLTSSAPSDTPTPESNPAPNLGAIASSRPGDRALPPLGATSSADKAEEETCFRVSVVGDAEGRPMVQLSFAHIQWHLVADRAYDLAAALAEAATQATDIAEGPERNPANRPPGTAGTGATPEAAERAETDRSTPTEGGDR